MKKTMFLTAALVSLCAAMAVAQTGKLVRTMPPPPAGETLGWQPIWVSSVPDEDDRYVYYVGTSIVVDDEMVARNDANDDGFKQLAQTFESILEGIGERGYTNVKNASGGYDAYVKSDSASNMRYNAATKSMKPKERFTEVYQVEGQPVQYKVYSLMRADKKNLDKSLDTLGKDVAKVVSADIRNPNIPPEAQARLNELFSKLNSGLTKAVEVDYSADGGLEEY